MSNSDTSQTADVPSSARKSPTSNTSDDATVPQTESVSTAPELRAELAELFCSFCMATHPTSHFTEAEQRKTQHERLCINITGSVRLCPHMTMKMTDIWNYFEGCCNVDSDDEMASDPTITKPCWFCVISLSEEFSKVKEHVRKPTYTFYHCEKDQFDDIGRFDIEWTLPLAVMHPGDESGITAATMREKLQEFESKNAHIICSHAERENILAALVSVSGDVNGQTCSAGECSGCTSEYFAEKHDDVIFLRRETVGVLKRQDEGKPVLYGCNGLVEQLELCGCRSCQ